VSQPDGAAAGGGIGRPAEIAILGETRAADQVIQLRLRDPSAPLDSVLDATFRHEWAHYLQFSTTSIGILLSSYRRSCVAALVNAVIESPTGVREGSGDPNSGATAEYWRRLAALKQNWLSWHDEWFAIGQRAARDVRSVRMEPDGLVVTLEGLAGEFRLPIGPKQIFEGWAWLVEKTYQIGARNLVERVAPSRGADALLYTWPLWVLSGQYDTALEDLRLSDAMGRLLPLLFAASFYDQRVLRIEGTGVAPEFAEAIDVLAERNVTCGRLFWQLLRDQKRGPWALPRSDVLDDALAGMGLPRLSSIVAATQALVGQMAAVQDRDTEEAIAKARRLGFAPQLLHAMVERDLLTTTAQNLAVVAEHLDAALLTPLELIDAIEPAVCAIDKGDHYVWISAHFGPRLAGDERAVADNRVRLRQQLSMFEHVFFQYVYGGHLGCYGSPEWRIPINACPAATACMALPQKRGIEFCVDADWRRKVASILAPAFEHSGTELTDGNVPGISAAAREFDEWVRSDQAADGEIDSAVLGIDWRIA
jgi:hypothetical protein